MKYLPPIVKIEILDELNNIESLIFNRLLPSFLTVEQEAKNKENDLLEYQNTIYDQDIHNELQFSEDLYFENINYQNTQLELRQECLNLFAVHLFHMLEKRLDRIYSIYHQTEPKRQKGENLLSYVKRLPSFNPNYNINNDLDWKNLIELNDVANAVKHGEGRSFDKVKTNYPKLLNKYNEICIDEESIRKYIQSMRNFWQNVLI